MSDVIKRDILPSFEMKVGKEIPPSSVEISGTQGKYIMRDIARYVLPDLINDLTVDLNERQRRTLQDLASCKTGEMGYNASYCPECNKIFLHACSCNNRMCPSCQALDTKIWIENRKAEVIPEISYYHGVATLPSDLDPLTYLNQKNIYALLQKTSAQAIIDLSNSEKYGRFTPGIVSVLHTAGSNLWYHVHAHMIISGGGLTIANKFVETKHKGFYLPEKVVAKVFRGKFLEGLKSLYDDKKLVIPDSSYFESKDDLNDPIQWLRFIDRLYQKDWVFYIKETYNGNGNALEYLGKYVYHTAIQNSRIVSFTEANDEFPEGQVVFSYKDYSAKNNQWSYEWKTMSLTPREFMLRFLKHVLPKYYSRVRYFGFLSNPIKTKSLKIIAEWFNRIFLTSFVKGKHKSVLMDIFYGKDIQHCPYCNSLLKNSQSFRHRPAIPKKMIC